MRKEKEEGRRMGPAGSGGGDGLAGFFPGFEGAGVGGAAAFGLEDALGDAGAVAGAAVEDELFVGVGGEHGGPEFAFAAQVAEREEVGALDDAVAPFAGFAHVDENRLAGGHAAGGFVGREQIGGERAFGDHKQSGECGEDEQGFHAAGREAEGGRERRVTT